MRNTVRLSTGGIYNAPNYTVGSDNFYIVDTTNGGVTINLPYASQGGGQEILVYVQTFGTGGTLVVPQATDSIGELNLGESWGGTLGARSFIWLISDGQTNWMQIYAAQYIAPD